MAIGSAYAKGKWALGECARSGRKMLLRNMIADGYYPNLIVDPEWYEPKHPQESLPSVRDPTALFRPAPERDQSGAVIRFRASDTVSIGFSLGGNVNVNSTTPPPPVLPSATHQYDQDSTFPTEPDSGTG